VPGACPGFLQPVGRRCSGADEILHTHDDDCRLPAAIASFPAWDEDLGLFSVEGPMTLLM
jgi:hypothetical protein